MRGHDNLNFPAFDAARDRAIEAGWKVISPADIDRESGVQESDEQDQFNTPEMIREFVKRDTHALLSLRAEDGDAIAMLTGWSGSKGATAEYFIAQWLGLRVLDAETMEDLKDITHADNCTKESHSEESH